MADKKQSILASKLIERYAADDQEARDWITAEVKKFLVSKGARKLAASDIQTFERKVETQVKKIKQTREEKAKGPSAKDVVLNKERTQGEVKELESLPLSYLTYDQASVLEHQRQQREERRRNEEKKRRLKAELDAQIQENQNKGSEQEKIEQEYADNVRRDYEKYQQEQKERANREAEQMAALRRERDAQLNALNARRDRETRRNKAEEAATIDAALRALKEEKETKDRKAREQRAFMDVVIAENEENKRIRAERRKQEQQEEKKLQEEYARRLDEQERVRQETFERMKAKSSQNQKMYLAATAEKTRLEKEDEAKALAYQQEKVRKDAEAADRAARERELEKQRLRDALAEQVAERARQNEANAAYKSDYVKACKEEARRAQEEAKEADRRRRQQAIEHRMHLLNQIREKQERENETDGSVMTEAEKKLNRRDIERLISKDEFVVKSITVKLEDCKRVGEAKKRRALGIRGGPADLAEDDF